MDPHAVGDETDEEEHRQNPVAKMVSMVQDGLIGVLYMMGKDMAGSYFIAVLTMFVDCAQLAALASPMLFNTPDHSAQSNQYLNPLHDFFDVFHFANMSNMNDALVPVALVLVFLLLFNVVHVAYCWVYQIFGWFFVVRILRACVIILGGVLYMPILTVLGATVHCNGIGDLCGIYKPLALLAALFFIPFVLITSATFFDPQRDGEGPYTMPHARVAVAHQLVRTVLAILAAILPGFYKGEDLQGVLMFWAILLTVSSGALVFSYVWLQPYYRPRFNSLRATLATVVFWFSFCFAMSGIWGFDPEQSSPAVLFFGGLFLMIPFMHVVFLWRTKALRINFFPDNASLLFGDMEAELKIRFVLEDAVVEMQTEARHRVGKKKQDSSIETAHTKAATWYSKAVNLYPKSALLCAMQAQFFIYEMDKPLLARKALLEAESRGAKLDIAFAIYKTKKYTEENASQNSDIMTWVACEKYWKLSKFYDRRCCILLCEFWTGLGDTKLKVSAIQTLADEIALAIKDAAAAYTKLIKLKPNDLDILNTYAGFLESIRNDPEQAQKMKARAQVIRGRAGKETGNDGKFNDSDCSILRVDASGTSQTGIILSANEVSGRIFNQPSSSLVGKVVSTLLLPPFTSQFEEIMEDYLQHGSEEYFNETFKTYVYLDGHYVVMPCSLELKPFSTDGINFQVFVRVKQRSMSSQVVLVDPDTKRVIGVTSQARNNLQRHFATSDLKSIEDVIPNYGQRRAEFLTPDGADLTLKFGESVNLQIKSIHLHGPKAPLVDELTFLFSAGGEGPVPLEVYHTDTEQNSHAEDTDQLLENDNFALDPIREQSEGSEASRSKNTQEFAGENSGASDDEATADQTTGDQVTGEGHSTTDGESMLEGFKGQSADESTDDIPRDARLVVNLEDDNESVPFANANNASGSLSEGTDKKSISGNDQSRTSFSASEPGGGSVVSSVASSGVGASRRIFLNADNKLDPSLNRFRQLYKMFVFLTMLVIVTVYLVRDGQMNTQMETLDFTPKSGMRRYRAVRIAYMANSMYLLSKNFILPSGYTEIFCRQELVESAEELQALDQKLFNMKSRFDGQLLQYYSEEVVWLHRVIQEPNITYRKYSMFDASQAFASGARFLSEKSLDLLSNDDPDVHFLVDNIVPYSKEDVHYPGFLQALNYTTRAFAQLSKKTQRSMDTISVVLAATVLLGFLILLVVMLIPLAAGIDRSKVEVFRHLIGMPRSVFPTIAGRFSARLLDVHDETAEGTIDVHQQQSNTEAEAGATTKRKKISGGGASKRGGNNTDERSIASVEAALKASSNKYLIIGKIGVSLIVLIVYFTCTLYWNFQTEHLLEDASFVADYANLRMVTLMWAILKIRLLETGGKQYGGFDVTYEQVKTTLNELDAIQQGLLNGDEHRHLKGIVHATHDKTQHKELLFENGCIGMKTPYYTGIPCLEYNHGVIADGLLSGYRSWIRMAMQYLHNTHLDEGGDAGHHKLTEAEVHERLEMVDFIELSDLEEFYLGPALKKSTSFYVEYEHWVFERIHTLSMNACIIVVVALAACYFFTTRLLYSLDKEIKRTRSLVFMIPDDILATHPKIKTFLGELARRQAKATR